VDSKVVSAIRIISSSRLFRALPVALSSWSLPWQVSRLPRQSPWGQTGEDFLTLGRSSSTPVQTPCPWHRRGRCRYYHGGGDIWVSISTVELGTIQRYRDIQSSMQKSLHASSLVHSLATCHILELQLLDLSLGHLATLSNSSSMVALFGSDPCFKSWC